MWNSILAYLKMSVRSKAGLFWLLAFPLILATLFNAMFGQLNETYRLDSLDVAVVNDDAWNRNPYLDTFIDGIGGIDGDDADGKLIVAHAVASMGEAERLMGDYSVVAAINATDDGGLRLSISSQAAAKANAATGTNSLQISLTVLRNLIARYNATDTTIRRIAAENPRVLGNAKILAGLGAAGSYCDEITLTHFTPDATARFFYALFGMVSLMAMSFGINIITGMQANLSALGLRQSVAPTPKWKQATAAVLVSWLCTFASMTVLMLYIRYVCGVGMGGREPMAVLGIAVAAFMSSGLGLFIGALPRLDASAKTGISVALACFLSLFAGLYGTFAMDLSDLIDRQAPALSMLNPAKQVTNLFYDLMYFDDYRPFFQTVGTLAAFGFVFLAAAALLLRRQRYDYL